MIRVLVRKIMATLPVEMTEKYTKIMAPEPRTPVIKTGRRPNRSESRANSGCEATVAGSDGSVRIHPDFWHSERLTLTRRGQPEQILDFPHPGSGYAYEIDHVNACIRAGRLESDILPWSTSLDLVGMTDRLREDWGVRYPQET